MDRLFSFSNLLVMPFWALMIVLPRWWCHRSGRCLHSYPIHRCAAWPNCCTHPKAP